MRTPVDPDAPSTVACDPATDPATGKARRESEGLAREVRACVAAVDAYGSSRRTSLDSMRALIAAPPGSRPAGYGTFHESVDRVVSGDGTVRDFVTALKVSAAERFRAWGEESASFEDGDTAALSRRGRAEAAMTFRLAAVDADAMLVQSASFAAYLSDLRTILSNDLTEKGVAGASNFAARARVSNGRLDGMTRPVRASLEAAAAALSPEYGTVRTGR